MVQRQIAEIGRNRLGQHIKISSTTLHKLDDINEDGWGILANFTDTIKLTPREKSVQVILHFKNISHIKSFFLGLSALDREEGRWDQAS